MERKIFAILKAVLYTYVYKNVLYIYKTDIKKLY